MRQNALIAKYEITGNQVVLYLRELPPQKPLRFTYALRAKYPWRVRSPKGTAYEYYQPANRAESEPTLLPVAGN